MSKKQVYNPYLPSYEYIPDGEPHVFGERIYLYGSHDRFSGADFCLNDYVCYSADVKDLTDWRYEGVIYRKVQDPRNQNIPADAQEPKPGAGAKQERCPGDLNPPGIHAMWAPDVVKGLDGRYYLYYCLDFLPEVAVAVSDSPAGKYEFHGLVRHADGTILGQREGDLEQFDPGIFIDDDENIYLYSGNAPMRPEWDRGRQGSQVMRLERDMLTLKEEPKLLLPSILESEGTGFEGHEFFEASSIRKIGGVYYFVYSSVRSHELCYAVSDRPDEGYKYGGTLVDIGDIFLDGREEKDSLNCLGNTHGGIECADGQWYVFYHRQTDRTNYSRQGCAEKIWVEKDGSIRQAEVTSCGLNDGPLEGKGCYPANICCHLRGREGIVMSLPHVMGMKYPFLTQDISDIDPGIEADAMEEKLPIQYIANMKDGAVAGYKYFAFEDTKEIEVTVRISTQEDADAASARGYFIVSTEADEEECGRIPIRLGAGAEEENEQNGRQWIECSAAVRLPKGVHALYFRYEGTGSIDFVRYVLG